MHQGRHAARAGELRRQKRNPLQNIYIKKVEKKKLFGYDKDELLEHGDQDLSGGEPFWTYGSETARS